MAMTQSILAKNALSTMQRAARVAKTLVDARVPLAAASGLVRTHTHPLRSVQMLARFTSTDASKFGDAASANKYAWAETDLPPPSPGRGFLGRSANFDVTKRQGQLERWEWLVKLLGFMNEDDRLYRDSTCLFQSCVNQTALPEFYRALHLTPNFRSQQALLMVHVWLVHRRLALEGTEGKVMQELMFDRLWEETIVRIRYLNVSELTVNKHLAEVQQVGFNACISYDRGLKDSPAAFQNAIAKHLLENETPTGQRIASTMAEYMKRELKNLEKVDAKYIIEGTIPWGPHPVASADAPASEEDQEYTLIGQKFGNWRTALDNRGKLYYWNQTTRYSVWDRPTGNKLNEGLDSGKK
uniref:WW domain-containing protein n=1 Tax=Globisporangium ultimum (strain ATCC 200006 / CBS 805.95 / DAOM BR144) TaxID=431595 RepID=K3WST7_GLOUD